MILKYLTINNLNTFILRDRKFFKVKYSVPPSEMSFDVYIISIRVHKKIYHYISCHQNSPIIYVKILIRINTLRKKTKEYVGMR